MNIVWAIMTGIILGIIATRIIHGRGLGMVGNSIVGSIGAIVGNAVFRIFEFTPETVWADIITSAIGAILLLIMVDSIRSGMRR